MILVLLKPHKLIREDEINEMKEKVGLSENPRLGFVQMDTKTKGVKVAKGVCLGEWRMIMPVPLVNATMPITHQHKCCNPHNAWTS